MNRAQNESGSIFGGILEAGLFVAASLAVAGVTLYFDVEVNRVFDVPKAMFLKSVAGATTLVWLLWACFRPQLRWKGAQLFGAPVLALALAVTASAYFSIDAATSLNGVYERQFGLHGFLGCVGLYFVLSTTLRDRRGGILALVVLVVLGGLIGAYALIQAVGADPWPFFREPNDKVYAYLGNATFAGNALALIFPISVMLAVVGVRANTKEPQGRMGVGLGVLGVVALLILPGLLLGLGLGARDPGGTAQTIMKFTSVLGVCGIFFVLGMSRYGPEWLRAEDEPQQRLVEGIAAGAVATCALLIAVGIFCTRTRGAWVGTAAALALGLILMPVLFRANRVLATWLLAGGVGLVTLLMVGIVGFAMVSNSVTARTLKSIPMAFFSDGQNLGKGQGTRPYLWSESIRVLTNHEDTLRRQYEDEDDRTSRVKGPILADMPFLEETPRSDSSRAFDTGWRRAQVWLLGIGIETYRFAFMSHKSKRLEELDPMTNHDNPHNNYLYVLASFGLLGLLAYLWLLGRLLWVSVRNLLDDHRSFSEQCLAFGIILSFSSYAVYSIAGFDSVACSVFFYYLLGAAAVLFQPVDGTAERRSTLGAWVLGQVQHRLGRSSETIPVNSSPRATAVNVAFTVVFGVLYLQAILGGLTIYQAERTFSGDRSRRPTIEGRVKDIEKAIRLSPHESYYKQTLGTTYAQGAGQYLAQSRRLQQAAAQARATDPAKSQQLLQQSQAMRRTAETMTKKAEIALLSALDHAWAPENIYISLFQALYAIGKDRAAEQALERALRHSPHLGAVRANLAALKIARGAWSEALVDCEWVIEVDRKSALAYRACGKAKLELGDIDGASEFLTMARRLKPEDPRTRQFIQELRVARRKRGDFGSPPTPKPAIIMSPTSSTAP